MAKPKRPKRRKQRKRRSPASAPAVPAPDQDQRAARSRVADVGRGLSRGDGPWGAALFLLVAVCYFPATGAGFVWDDSIVTASKAVREWSGLWQLWFETETTYHPDNTREGHFWPIVYSTFWLEHKLWGFAPLGYHLVNVLLHFANSWLVWRLLLRLGLPGAWLAAAVFAVHPVHVEAVVWVIARKDQLSTLFYLAAAIIWLRCIDAPRPRRYLGALGSYIAALFSKTMAATLPPALLIGRWLQQGRIRMRDLLSLLPFFAVGVAIAVADTFFYQARESATFDYSVVERLLIASRAVWFYLGKLLWPLELAVIYPRWEIDPAALSAWLWPTAGVAAAALLWALRGRLGRGPLAGALFFALALSPVLGMVDNTYMQWSFVADRYQYLASVGVIAVLVGAAAQGTARLSRIGRVGAFAVAAVVLAVLGTLTWRHAGIYTDNVTFYSHIVALNPAARDAHLNLGAALSDQGRHEEALAAAQVAIRQRPEHAGGYANASHALIDLGRYEEAERMLRRGRAVEPGHRNTIRNLAVALERQDRFEEALRVYDEWLGLDPLREHAWAGRAGALLRMQRHEEALAFLRRGLSELPDLAPSRDARTDLLRARMRIQMSVAAHRLGRSNEAAEHRRRALRRVPDAPEPAHDMAELLREEAHFDEAVAWYGVAIERDPEFAVAWAGMGDALFAQGRYDEAMERLARADELLPADSAMRANLQRLIARTAAAQGRPAAAVQNFRATLERAPDDVRALMGLVTVHFREEEFAAALDALETLSAITPDNAEVHANMGVVLYRLGRAEEALARLERALAMDPNLASARNAIDVVRQATRGGHRDATPSGAPATP